MRIKKINTTFNKRAWSAVLIIAFIAVAAMDAAAGPWTTVKWVDDGDTILLADNRRIRYIGIDAPEIAHPKYGKKSEPFGRAALKHNMQLVKGKKVRLVFDAEKRDRYGRLLAYVFLKNGMMVNEEMLRSGYAYVVARFPNDRYDTRFLRAQRVAMNAQNGLWRDWKEGRAGGYVGNSRSKRFHLPVCPLAQAIRSKNRVAFATRWEAFWAGYSPAKRCK